MRKNAGVSQIVALLEKPVISRVCAVFSKDVSGVLCRRFYGVSMSAFLRGRVGVFTGARLHNIR